MESTAASKTKKYLRLSLTIIVLVVLFFYIISVWWSSEPDPLDIEAIRAEAMVNGELIVGYTTVETVAQVGDTLLNKSGGFLSNDIILPSAIMDNMPAWEYGALVHVRDMAKILRNDLSRSQSQSLEDIDLKEAEPHFNIDRRSWFLPEAEDEYRDGIQRLRNYRDKLADPNDQTTQFYARADNLREYLKVVEKRLGSLSQRLSASVGQERENLDLAGDSAAAQSTQSDSQITVKTGWFKIDDVFHEARGSTWATIQVLKAIEVDFADVLEKKNARASLRQIIRELESTQDFVWSPMVLNGEGFGLMANHSLVMASYISRANAGVIDLRDLLQRG